MGTDIHLHTEIKVSGTWHHYSHPRIGRFYDLFGRLAGVRGSTSPIVAPRGLPDDMTFTTRFDLEHWTLRNTHDHGWVSGVELAIVLEWFDREQAKKGLRWIASEHEFFGYLFGNGWGFDESSRASHPKALQAVRAIFWFDC